MAKMMSWKVSVAGLNHREADVATVTVIGNNVILGTWLLNGARMGLRLAGARKGAEKVAGSTEFNKMFNRKKGALSHLSYTWGECHFHILIRSLLEEIT
jgi:hypothetical protein